MKLWKLALKYWVYNQLFFVLCVIITACAGFFILTALNGFYNYITGTFGGDSVFYLSIILFYGAILLALFNSYKLFKLYWRQTLVNYSGSFMALACTAFLPCTFGAVLFALLFYLHNGSVTSLLSSVNFYLLILIHGSFSLILLTMLSHADYIILIYALANLIPLAFFARYVYLLRGTKLPLLKPAAFALVLFAICGNVINYAVNNGNTVRSHNFAYENGLSSVDLKKYKITNPGNILPKLNEVSTLQLTQEEWLKLDGAEAAYPVYSAYANACYDGIAKYQYKPGTLPWQEQNKINEEFEKYVAFNNTVYAFKDLINKRCDVFFGAMPSKQQQTDAAALGEELVLTPIAQEAFVFFVSSDNPVSSLTTQQVRDIYSGKTKNWQPLGGDDRRILAFQRPKGSGSQTLLQHIMGDTPIMEPLKTEYIPSMGGIGESVAEYNGDAGALGFSFKFFLTGMLGREDAPVKMLAIDGVSPTDENIRSGKYPFATKLYAITLKSNTKPQLAAFLNWMQSSQGQELAEKVGYVRLQ